MYAVDEEYTAKTTINPNPPAKRKRPKTEDNFNPSRFIKAQRTDATEEVDIEVKLTNPTLNPVVVNDILLENNRPIVANTSQAERVEPLEGFYGDERKLRRTMTASRTAAKKIKKNILRLQGKQKIKKVTVDTSQIEQFSNINFSAAIYNVKDLNRLSTTTEWIFTNL